MPVAEQSGATYGEERDGRDGRDGEAPAFSEHYVSDGARKEKLRQRTYRAPGVVDTTPSARMLSAPRTARRATRRRYAELHCASAFSFLAGASLPEDLIERAAELELPAVALIDRNGVYGAPRFYKAARAAGIKALVGVEVVIGAVLGANDKRAEGVASTTPGARGNAADPTKLARENEARVTVLVADRTGYQNLCRMLTAGALAHPKGEARVDWDTLAAHAGGLWCLTGGEEGPLARTLRAHGSNGRAEARRLLDRLGAIFAGRLSIEVQRHALRSEEELNQALFDLARGSNLPLLATNGVRYAREDGKRLYDVLTCLRLGARLDGAGALLDRERQRHLKGAGEMAELWSDHPVAIEATLDLARSLDFTLADLGYRFPDYPLPPGETPASYLRQLTWNGARARFRPLTAKAQAQIEKELALIEKLELAGYFLIVWDVIRFCQEHGILVQGRGSAANSAVCYALSITAVDPVKMELLFERFLSEERGEWPDIDLDLPSGDQREKVIQYVYRRYGVRGAAMTANVITYRDRMAAREVAKVLGYDEDEVDRLSKQLGSWGYDLHRGDGKDMGVELRGAGFDPGDSRIRLLRRDVVEHPEPSPPPRAALGRHGGLGLAARRGGSARAGGDGEPRGGAVGQGRLRRPRNHQGRSARARHAQRARGSDADDPAQRGRAGRLRAPAAGRPRHLPHAADRRHRRPLPGREPRADGVVAAPPSHPLLRPGDPDRDHPARPHRRPDGEPVLRAAHGPPAGDLPAPEPRSRSSSARSACRSSRSRSSRSRWWPPASRAARPRSCAAPWGSSARWSAWTGSRSGCAPG